GLEAVLLGRAAGDGVEADVGQLLALVEPHLGAVVATDEPGRHLVPLLGQVALEHPRGLDHVVVHADQHHVLDAHGRMVAPMDLAALWPGRTGPWQTTSFLPTTPSEP